MIGHVQQYSVQRVWMNSDMEIHIHTSSGQRPVSVQVHLTIQMIKKAERIDKIKIKKSKLNLP